MNTSRTRLVVAVLALLLSSFLSPLSVGPASAVTTPGVAATKLPVPADASLPANPRILGVACGAPGFCVAVGSYLVPNGASVTVAGLIETLSGGTWTAKRAPVPAGGLPFGAVTGVACSGTSTCAAYGAYAATSSTSAEEALILTGGAWKAQTIGAPSGGAFPLAGYGNPPAISGVGCSGVDACALVGNFDNSASELRGWTSVYHASSWEGPKVVPTPNDATAQESHLNGMACGTSLCQAVGNYTNSVGWEPLVVSIDPGGDTVNAPSSHPNLPQGAIMINDLTGISCDSGGSCAAYGSYPTSGGSNTEAMVFPVGGTAFQPQQPPTLIAQSTTIHPAATVADASCVSGTCVLAGYYYDTSSAYHPFLDGFGAGGGSADQPPSSTIINSVRCGGSTFCVGVNFSSYSDPMDVLVGTTWVTAPFVLPADASASASPILNQDTLACDSATSCWVVGTYDSSGFADHITPTAAATTPPSVSSTSGMPTFALGSSTTFGWHGTAGSSAIDHYTVEVRRSTWKAGFGSWSTPTGWSTLSASTASVAVPLPVGDDTCVRVQAVSTAHVASAWSSARCTARPLDDRALSATSAWARLKGSGYYFGTYTSTKTNGAIMTLSSAQFDRLALVVTKCASCGKVAVYSGSTLLATINLYHSTTVKRVLIALSTVSLRTANVRLRVVTSGKTIQIDGVGVSRT